MSAVEATATVCNLTCQPRGPSDHVRGPTRTHARSRARVAGRGERRGTTYALLAHDRYLLSTATASLAMQLTSLVLRTRARRTYPSSRPIRLDVSTDELPRV